LKDRKSLLKQIPAIADFFSLGSPIKIKHAGGDANANFFVETCKGDYFVKIVLEPHTRSNKLKEAVYVECVFSHGIPAAAYLSGQDGAVLFEDGEVMAMAQNAIRGSSPNITIANASQIGRLLGRMSLIPATKLPYRYGWLSTEYVENSLIRLSKDFSRDSDARRILSIYDSCNTFVKDVLPSLPQGIIHADMHSENVLFNNGKLVAVVDWEDSTIAPSLLDFASSAAYWCFDGEVMRPRMYKAFYESYTKERPFAELEVKHLEDCIKYVGVVQTMWRFLNYPEDDREEVLWALELSNCKILKI